MIIRSKILGVLVLGVLFVGIFGAGLLGLWQTKSDRTPARIRSGEGAGAYNPADIRGSYAFGEISELFNIPLEVLAQAFRLPADADPATFKNKDLEVLYADIGEDVEIGTDSVRLFVAYYTGLPYKSGEGAYLPEPAVNILKTHADLTLEQIAYLDAHTVELGEVVEAPSSQGDTGGSEEHGEEAGMVRGKTIFADLLDWGLSEDQIEAIIGNEIPSNLMLVRDYCTQNGLSFGQVKAELQAALDQLGE